MSDIAEQDWSPYDVHSQWSPAGRALVTAEGDFDWDRATALAMGEVEPVSIVPGRTDAFDTRRTRLVLPTLHRDQARAFWKFKLAQSRRYLLRCGRRYGKTDFGKTWLLDGFARGWECAWYAPQHKTWAEAYSEMVDHIAPVLGPGSSKGGAVMRGTTGGRIDFWTMENPIAGRGRKYRRVVIDEAAFGKNGNNTVDGSTMTMFEKVILPTLFDYGGEILVMSNSAGKNPDNFLYQISPGGGDLEERYGFVEHHATTADNPLLPKRMRGESPVEWLARRQHELDQLKKQNDALVYDQEHQALFVDWSGVAFFSQDKWLLDGVRPAPMPAHCDAVFAVIDTAVKTGYENDGTAVIYYALDRTRSEAEGKVLILDWDIQKIEGASLESWLPSVYVMLEGFARTCGARMPPLGAFIEDKGSGTILLQQAKRRGWKAHEIDNTLTALGKDERALSVSGYHYRGLCKITQPAFDKVHTYNRQTHNHLIEQVTSFRMADKDAGKREDDLLDCYCYGLSIALGNSEGF